MLIIRLEPYENGAHDNQKIDRILTELPEGYAAVPPELEVEAEGYLPFIDLTVEDGQIVGVAQGTIPPREPEPEPEPTPEEQLRADVDYIAAMAGLKL